MTEISKFSAYHIILSGETTRIDFEDELEEAPLIAVLRELSQRLSDLADYYEAEGINSLYEEEDDEGEGEGAT